MPPLRRASSRCWRGDVGTLVRGRLEPARARSAISTRSRRLRAACAAPSPRAQTPYSAPPAVSLPSCLQSSQDDGERRRATRPSCRSSSTIVSESGSAHRRWPRGAGSAGRTQCPCGVQERPRRPRWGGCGQRGCFGWPASRRQFARLGWLGTRASGRGAWRPPGEAAMHRGVT